MNLRSRIVDIQGFQFTGQPRTEWPLWAADSGYLREVGTAVYVDTREGPLRANPGDWILRGTKGEFYPCDAEVVQTKYEILGAENDGR